MGQLLGLLVLMMGLGLAVLLQQTASHSVRSRRQIGFLALAMFVLAATFALVALVSGW